MEAGTYIPLLMMSSGTRLCLTPAPAASWSQCTELLLCYPIASTAPASPCAPHVHKMLSGCPGPVLKRGRKAQTGFVLLDR